MALAKTAVAGLARVVAVGSGTVDINPLVAQIDGAGNATPHGTIYGRPYIQISSGTSAIIMPPTVGDIGLVVYCDRDISSAVANKGPANPGSRRIHDMSDGVFICGLGNCNQTPTQFIQFTPTGINITTPTLTVTGNVVVTGDVHATGTSLHTHVHGNVATGPYDTGLPL